MIGNYPNVVRAIEQVRASNAKVVGLAQWENSPEFAIWQLLGATEDRVRVVNLHSRTPGLHAKAATVDAVRRPEVTDDRGRRHARYGFSQFMSQPSGPETTPARRSSPRSRISW